jgi:hypothetical protein
MTHSTTNTVAVAQHRIPQTFELRPSGPIAAAADRLLDYPDELMIDWGNTPAGSTAMIYWPQAQGIDVVRLARRLYGTDEWSLQDPNTLMCKVNGGVSFLPIPGGGTERIPGLFTVDLPSDVKVGQEFNIVVRRFATRRPPATLTRATRGHAAPREPVQTNWRYTVGTFQVKIPVAHGTTLLPAEENTYSIMKWRLDLLAPTDRWYPVLQRYVDYLADRVTAFGGDPSSIIPSPSGVPHSHPGPGGGVDTQEYTGKIEGLVYDRFGDFEGFLLRTEHGHEHRFHTDEEEIGKLVRWAWGDRIVVSVRVRHDHPHIPTSIVLRTAPHHRR